MGASNTERHPRSVLVYVKADRSVCLEPREIVRSLYALSFLVAAADSIRGRQEEPVAQGAVSRNPFKSEQRIQIPSSAQLHRSDSPDSIDQMKSHSSASYGPCYTSTLVFKNIAPNMRWRRLLGTVTRWEVYEDQVD